MQNVHPWVTQVTFEGGQIVLTVRADDFHPDEPVELSGCATQNGGGFAAFYDIQPAKKNPDDSVFFYIRATPSQEFKKGEDVTVVLRAARLWNTVLKQRRDEQGASSETGQSEGAAAGDGTVAV